MPNMGSKTLPIWPGEEPDEPGMTGEKVGLALHAGEAGNHIS